MKRMDIIVRHNRKEICERLNFLGYRAIEPVSDEACHIATFSDGGYIGYYHEPSEGVSTVEDLRRGCKELANLLPIDLLIRATATCDERTARDIQGYIHRVQRLLKDYVNS